MRTVRASETPSRITKMYQEIFQDWDRRQKSLSKSFEIIDNNMVVEKGIFLPFHV